jgi:hypothetical protein
MARDRYTDSAARLTNQPPNPFRNFQCPAGVIAFVPRVNPASDATRVLVKQENICTAAIAAGAPAQNPNLTFEAMQAIRQREAEKANKALDALVPTLDAFATALAANRVRLTTPPPPADVIEAARHAEIRAWFVTLAPRQQNDKIQAAVTTLDQELLAALFHAPAAFGIISDKTRAVVGEVWARATNLDAYENLLIGEEQLRAAQEGIVNARRIVSQVLGWQNDDYERADREATRRAQFEIVSSQRLNV